MSNITITVQKNAAITDFSVSLNNAGGVATVIQDDRFTKQSAGVYTYLLQNFFPGATLQGNFTVFGQGDAVGTPLAWALFNVDKVDQNPHVVGQIFSLQTQEQTPFSIPIVAG
jgi:hypothetical protein